MIKNIVLVHGAIVDGSSWAKIIPLLEAHGHEVTAVQNPLTALADDVAATQRALDLQDGPVLLVGHSWGGVAVTEAWMRTWAPTCRRPSGVPCRRLFRPTRDRSSLANQTQLVPRGRRRPYGEPRVATGPDPQAGGHHAVTCFGPLVHAVAAGAGSCPA